MQSTYLKFENINISDTVPLGFPILFITIKPQSTHVINGLSWNHKKIMISHSGRLN